MKQEDKHPAKTIEKVIHGSVQDIPNPEYVAWLEYRVDYWRAKALELDSKDKKNGNS